MIFGLYAEVAWCRRTYFCHMMMTTIEKIIRRASEDPIAWRRTFSLSIVNMWIRLEPQNNHVMARSQNIGLSPHIMGQQIISFRCLQQNTSRSLSQNSCNAQCMHLHCPRIISMTWHDQNCNNSLILIKTFKPAGKQRIKQMVTIVPFSVLLVRLTYVRMKSKIFS